MGADADAGIIFTIGSSTRQLREFLALLGRYGITILADVRTFPYSKRFPHFSKDDLEVQMPARGLRYVYLGSALGGYRRGGYEAYIQTAEFTRGIDALEATARDGRAACMCAERLPWKCHRRFIAAAMEDRGWQVIHILDADRTWQPRPATDEEDSQ